ncbi:MAG TPA: aldehyde dehydrogenase family protein [Steroidobacteraceae bacterium]|nr:aldehyde dehydrogenase family protein [Steroidobacteraceae bacterium]
MNIDTLLQRCGVPHEAYTQGQLVVHSPIDGNEIARVAITPPEQVHVLINEAHHAFLAWRSIPAPRRGELIRLFAEELRQHKSDLGSIITMEVGKIVSEGAGEVQEMIDICDFAVGLSRQLHGLTIASERPGHRMMECWHPLGVTGVITAFNFPMAVWSWNAALALVCGNAVIWKPSEKAPLCALAVQSLFKRACDRFGNPSLNTLSPLIIGDHSTGSAMVQNTLVPLISATGSTRMGKQVATQVANRLGRCLLELGGNNALIVAPSADLSLALRAIVFGAVGTAGQRCTTTRRLIVHEHIHDVVVEQVKHAYQQLRIGDPLMPATLVGPLIDRNAFDAMQTALQQAQQQGGTLWGGERLLMDQFPHAYYVRPAIVSMPQQTEIVRHETFAPILYVMKYREITEAIAINNDVPQGLSSAIFTNDVREAELFMSSTGSDCGIANVNIGTSGAEIGGAFGGEKQTGGGRESGSDAWKAYMRRATNTINYSRDLPLAQGVDFRL